MSTTYDRSGDMYDSTRQYWAELAQQQAAEQIAHRDQEWQRLYAQCLRDIAYYEAIGNTTLAEHTRVGLQMAAEHHAARIAQIESDAAQQIAGIDAEYDDKERDYDQSRAPWPTSTPAPAWDEGYTPGAPYGSKNATDTPAPEQEVSILDRLFGLFS